MNQEQENMIRAQARKCNEECKQAVSGKSDKRDAVTRQIILRYYSKIQAICVPFSLFLVTIGKINGTLKDK